MFQESDRSDSNPQIPTPVRSAFLHKFRYRFHRTPSETYLRRSYFVRSAVSEAKTKIMTSSESEEQPQTSRKRSRRSNSGDDGGAGGKKARGRPRVDTQDATAADRRRTQIRLAQRAYRQRKETTISSLKNQSAQLHSIIEQMNKTFLKLNESTVKSGLLQLNPTLAQEFKLVTETFANLVKTASGVSMRETKMANKGIRELLNAVVHKDQSSRKSKLNTLDGAIPQTRSQMFRSARNNSNNNNNNYQPRIATSHISVLPMVL